MNKAEKMFARCIDSLEAGEWARGMALYHWRYSPKRTSITKVGFPKLPLPFIEYDDLSSHKMDKFRDKKVLVLNEQGFGDDIMFFRSLHYLLPEVSALAWQAYPETVEFLKLSAPTQVQFLTGRSLDLEYLKQFDCYTTTGNLFSILSTDAPLPLKFFYNVGDVQPPIENSVGVCWATNPKSPNGAARSIDIELLKNVLDDVEVHSLTRDEEAPDWIKPCPVFNDFLETAQLVSRLTNIVTVDTSIAHVGGSLGKDTFLIVKDHHDWRWRYVNERGYSLLYPTIKVVTLAEILSL